MGMLRKRGVTTYGKKTLFSRRADQPAQERIMEIDQKTMKRLQKKLAQAMACCSEASIDATYIARFDETAAQQLAQMAKKIQTLSRELYQEFKNNAPMEVWEDGEEETEQKQSIINRKKKGKGGR